MQYSEVKKKGVSDLMSALFTAVSEAEREREREEFAALVIGCKWKGFVDHKLYWRKKKSTLTAQRVFRGHRGRVKAEERKIEQLKRERMLLFDYFATNIQRLYRGYRDRKYLCDNHARKKYLREVEKRSAEVRLACTSHYEAQVEELKQKEKDQYLSKFHCVSKHLLYIASTSSIPGILAAKELKPELHEAFGATAESALRHHHLHQSNKYRPRLKERSLKTTVNTTLNDGSRKPFVAAVSNTRSLLSRPLKYSE